MCKRWLGHGSRCFSSGFTLLELLVVMVIIGLLATMAVLSVGTREPLASQEARRLAELLRLGVEEAVLQGREWGLRVTSDGYEFMVLGESRWRVVGDEILHPRKLPQDVGTRLTLEGEELSLEHETHDKNDQQEAITPQVLLLSSGEVSPFRLALVGHDQPTWYVTGTYDGIFAVHPAEERR